MTGIAALLVVVFIGSANALCSWPGPSQLKAFFNDVGEGSIVRPVSPSEVRINNAATLECIIRSGAFLLRREKGTNKYKCLQIKAVCDDAYVIHETPETEFDSIPDFCSFCGQISVGPEVWVAEKKTVPECAVPHTCPGGKGKKCTGCEPTTPDEGVCVAKNKIRKNYYNDHYYGDRYYDDNYYDGNQKSHAAKHGSVHTHYKHPHDKSHATKHGRVHTHYEHPHHKK